MLCQARPANVTRVSMIGWLRGWWRSWGVTGVWSRSLISYTTDAHREHHPHPWTRPKMSWRNIMVQQEENRPFTNFLTPANVYLLAKSIKKRCQIITLDLLRTNEKGGGYIYAYSLHIQFPVFFLIFVSQHVPNINTVKLFLAILRTQWILSVA